MNIETLNVRELSIQEQESTNGGFLLICAVALLVGIAIGIASRASEEQA